MRKFYLKAVKSGSPDKNIVEVEGFVKAEEKAKEMLSQLIKEGWSDIDTYVALSGYERDIMYFESDLYILRRDYFGDIAWFRYIYGTFCYVYDRIINDDEEAELEEWRNEKDIHVCDLTEEELKKLREEICVGSCYLSDFQNSFNINSDEVSDYAEGYEEYLEEEELQDTPQQFADYVSEKCA